MNEIRINPNQFRDRCLKIFAALNKPLLVLLGKGADVQEFTTNSAIFHYLIGYEFPETIMVISDKPIIVTSQKKATYLQGLDAEIIIKNKDDSNFQAILDSLARSSYLILEKDNLTGDFCKRVLDTLNVTESKKEVLNMLSIKDDIEIEIMRKCGSVSNYLLSKGIDMIRDNEFSKDELENCMNDKLPGINNNAIEFAFDPEYDSNNYYLRIGVRYKGYCTEIARPFMTDLSLEYEIQKKALELIKPDANSYDVIKQLISQYPDQAIKLYSIGLINEMDFNSKFIIKNNMTYCLNINDTFCNTFALLNDTNIFLTKKDAVDDYSEKGMKFRNRHHDNAVRLKEHQAELLDKLIDERVEYYKSHTDKVIEKSETKQISIYTKDSSVPRLDKIFLDKSNMYVIIPILSYSVPFHISSIKNVSHYNTENKLRINFKESKELNLSSTSNYDTKIKFISLTAENPEEIIADINEMKKEFNKPNLSVKEQPVLKERYRKLVLGDVYMRTEIKAVNKKSVSNLELHENGFKYNDIPILFSNIKNIFFQWGDYETRAIIHINLKDPILISKPTSNIQFFKKFTTSYLDVSKRDAEQELLDQQEEEEVAHINSEFQAFVENIEQEHIPVQVPEKGFLGVHSKEAVLFYVTSDCIVSFNDLPFFVLNFDDIEVVNFERVTFVTKTFDCVFIFKDKCKAPVTIGSIETTKLGYIKELLDEHNILFMQTKVNLNWGNLMSTILQDPLSFYENGGWADLIKEDESSEENESSSVSSSSEESSDGETSCDSSESVETESEDGSDESYDESYVSEDPEEEEDVSEESSSEDQKKKKRKK